MSGVNSDGETIILDNGISLKTIDKDDNEINIAGYLGELLFFGDPQFGNASLLISQETSGVNSQSGFISLGNDGTSTRIELSDITDPDNPVVLQAVEETLTTGGWNIGYDQPGSLPGGFEYIYGTYALTVADNQILQKFIYEGNNDGLSRVSFAERHIEAYTRALGLEDGTIIDRVAIDGTVTDAIRIGDGGLITFKLLSRFDFDGVGYAQFETGFNTGDYAYQFGAGLSIPADAIAGWSGGAIFGDATATVGTYNRLWINTGTSTNALFRRIAIVESTNQLAMADGTAAAPFYSFPTSPTTGMYLPLVNTLGFATNGTVKMQINSNSNVQFSVPTSFSSATPPSSATYGHGRVGSTVLQANVGSGGTHQMSVNGQTRFSVNNVGEIANVQDSITASTTQAQGQQPIVFQVNIVTVVANANDVVTLPTAIAGQIVRIKNEGANTLQVFPASGDSVNNGTVNASVTQAANTMFEYTADDTTNWTRVQLTIA
jgi:hypothetical protein